MKLRLFSFLLMVFYLDVSAQQQPQYTQYIFNSYILNPAISGIENYIDVKAGYRNQWTGFEGAPVTSYFSIHGPLGKSDLNNNPTSFGGQENNPMSRSYVRTYEASKPHHGIGLYGVSDKAGPVRRLNVNVTYAYHLGISAQTNVALGVAAGISSLDINKSEISLSDETDPILTAGNNNQLKSDLAVGLWLYGARYFFGIAGQQLIKPYTGINSVGESFSPVLITTVGYKFYGGENTGIIPSVLIRKAASQPISYDSNLKVAYHDKFWFGAGYRHKESVSALAGFYVNQLFNFSYSYDFATSKISTAAKGSHEVVIGLLLHNRYKVTCPQKNW